MRKLVTATLVWLAIFAAAGETNAQPIHPPELGAGVTWLVPRYGDYVTDEMTEPNAGVSLTLPFARQFAFESQVTLGRKSDASRERTEGLYILRIKQWLPGFEQRTVHPFVTYGLAGYYAHVVQRDVEHANGERVRGFAYSELEEPIATMFGVGIQRRLTERIAIRADAQLLTFLILPLGYSFSTSASVALGRYSTN